MASASFDLNPFGAAGVNGDGEEDMEDDQEQVRVEASRRPPMTPTRVDPEDEDEDKEAEPVEEEDVASPKEEEEETKVEASQSKKAEVKLSGKPKRGDTDETVVLADAPKTPVKSKPASSAKAPGAPRKAYVPKRHLRKDDSTLEVLVQKSLRTAQVRRILESAGLTTFTAEAIKEARKVVFAIMADLVHGGVLVSKAGNRVVVKSDDIDMAIGYKLGERARLYACEDMPKPRKRKTVNADGTPRLPPRRKPKAEAESGEAAAAAPKRKKSGKAAPKLAKTSAPKGTVKKRPRKAPGASAAKEDHVNLLVAVDE